MSADYTTRADWASLDSRKQKINQGRTREAIEQLDIPEERWLHVNLVRKDISRRLRESKDWLCSARINVLTQFNNKGLRFTRARSKRGCRPRRIISLACPSHLLQPLLWPLIPSFILHSPYSHLSWLALPRLCPTTCSAWSSALITVYIKLTSIKTSLSQTHSLPILLTRVQQNQSRHDILVTLPDVGIVPRRPCHGDSSFPRRFSNPRANYSLQKCSTYPNLSHGYLTRSLNESSIQSRSSSYTRKTSKRTSGLSTKDPKAFPSTLAATSGSS